MHSQYFRVKVEIMVELRGQKTIVGFPNSKTLVFDIIDDDLGVVLDFVEYGLVELHRVNFGVVQEEEIVHGLKNIDKLSNGLDWISLIIVPHQNSEMLNKFIPSFPSILRTLGYRSIVSTLPATQGSVLWGFMHPTMPLLIGLSDSPVIRGDITPHASNFEGIISLLLQAN